MEKIAHYTFLPWSRRGIGTQIIEKENFNSGTNDTSNRPNIDVSVTINRTSVSGESDTDSFSKNIRLFGPGDVVGIAKNAIIRTEPLDGVTNFEHNYLPYIEFFEEDFLWRYTPASVNDSNGADSNIDKRLRPWLALLVYKEDEFREGKFVPKATPLPFITILKNNLFAKDDQYWAWGHVHVNQSLAEKAGASISEKLDRLVSQEPNAACCRLLCPRKLEPNTKYRAFLVPAYEKGRLAGLQRPKEEIDATPSQLYSSKIQGTQMPYYYTWSFRTGAGGDFEELVRKLEYLPVDDRVGRQLMDIQSPGYTLEYEGNVELDSEPEDSKGAIYLEGALKPPGKTTKNFTESTDPEGKQMVKKLEALLNLDADLKDGMVMDGTLFEHNPFFKKEGDTEGQGNTNGNGEGDNRTKIKKDPIILPPIYGRWHRMVDRVEKSKPSEWINHLNLDPRQRTVAGFGTRVIQENQEEYMDRAWEQFEGIREANEKLRQAQFVERFSSSLFRNRISKLSNETLLASTVKLHSRILKGQNTLFTTVQDSRISNAVVKSELRKLTRPRGPIKTPSSSVDSLNVQLLKGSNAGTKKAAVRYDEIKVAADGSVTQLGNSLKSVITNPSLNTPNHLETMENIRNSISLTGSSTISENTANLGAAASMGSAPKVESVNISLVPRLNVVLENDRIKINTQGVSMQGEKFQNLSEDKFLTSQVIFSTYLTAENWAVLDSGEPLKINELTQTIKDHLLPEKLFSSRVSKRIHFGENIKVPPLEEISPIYIAPEFEDAMYHPLEDLSSESFVPNLNLIKNNSISILETNDEFIESYMVGLNHEFSRELLWREYLTDQRGSYFRQFWDVSGNANTANLKNDVFKESLLDIDYIHKWKDNELGKNSPALKNQIPNRLVLVIRGDLLRKYPNTIISLQQAQFEDPSNPDVSVPRKLKDGGEQLYPAFEAKVNPDIYFFGFNITIEAAKGKLEPPLDPGYFVVLKERTGELHFGMDITQAEDNSLPKFGSNTFVLTNNVQGYSSILLSNLLVSDSNTPTETATWNGLSWKDFPENMEFIDLEQEPESPKREQVSWAANAADMAYILYQNPFMMAIHASKMISTDTINS